MGEKDQKYDDLMAQIAAQTARADNAELVITDLRSKLTTIEGDRDGVRGQLVSLQEKVRQDESGRQTEAGLKEQVQALLRRSEHLEKERNDAMSPETLRKAVKERVALETAASIVMGVETRLDEMTDRQVHEAVIEKLHGTKVEKDKSDDYVRARYDSTIEGFAAGNAALSRVREHMMEKQKDEAVRKDSKSARDSFLENQKNAWKPTTKTA